MREPIILQQKIGKTSKSDFVGPSVLFVLPGPKEMVPNGVFQTVFFRFLTFSWHRRTTSRREEKMPENTCVLKQFVRPLLFGILTIPWARHSEKHRLENTVCYSLENWENPTKNGFEGKCYI